MTGLREDQARRSVSIAALVLANMTPLFGVFVLHWQVLPLLLLYWIENGIVGVFNVLRMIAAKSSFRSELTQLGLAAAFCLHYGFFNFIYGMFIVGFVGPLYGESKLVLGTPIELATHVARAIPRLGLGLPVISLAASHAVSFVVNFIQGGEYRRVSARQLFVRPYARVAVLHFTILGGAVLAVMRHSPAYLILALVVAKTAVDLFMFLLERCKLAKPRSPQAMEAHAAETA